MNNCIALIRFGALALSLALVACGSSSAPVTQASGTGSSSSGGASSSSGGVAATTCEGADATHKNVYFGDMHVHTLYSIDAYFFNGLNGPREAYRFAQGERESLPAGESDPYTAGRQIQLDRPLDFAAVTDHSDFLGDWRLLCQVDGALPIGINPVCNLVGNYLRTNVTDIVNGGAPPAFYILTTAAAPLPATVLPWQDELNIADDENKPCAFTTFPGFEWTSQFHNQMIHRDAYFAGTSRPQDVPHVSTLTDITAQTSDNTNDDWRLYDWLDQNCDPLKGCQTMSIPHNSNQSAGGMYLPRDPVSGLPAGRDGKALTLADAQLRAKYDRVIEIHQHKGNSECGVGLGIYETSLDPSCTLEPAKNVCRGLPQDPPECAQVCTGNAATDPDFCRLRTAPTYATGVCQYEGRNGASGPDTKCVAPLDMARNILADGLAIDDVLGVDPMKMAFIGSSDTHNGDPGDVHESNYPGHGGVLDDDPQTQLGYWTCAKSSEDPADPAHCTDRQFQDRARGFNPGGLAGVWAPENTRASVWSALQRGESFATSGPRIRIRTVASWTVPPADICDRLSAGDNPVDTGEMQGAVMGGDLTAGGSGAPYVVVWAQQDPGGAEPGLPLQKLDVVKGWSDSMGPHVQVYDGVAKTSAPVLPPSTKDCGAVTAGHPERLCAVWHDPDFKPQQRAYWYARAFEVPSCRWSTQLCVANQVDCGKLDSANGMFPASSGKQGYEGCCRIEGAPGSFRGSNAFNTITERAWASPVWYKPAAIAASVASTSGK
ncbi:DUF3604 domain-containing protein [Nevskia soli]|uniref:DUF3604 domain-containing protein n=1 Tax=Nevskia soli TaxID=418856 RepID=UPI000A065647|nr:DUF3604 domain-containing protein [Nevskia soli]